MTLAHWDDVERARRDVGDMRSWWRDLGEAAGAQAVGVQRVEVDPGARIGPVHVHAAEEEIFFVLSGSGLAWIDGAVHEIAATDTIVYPAGGPAHTLIAGDDGLDVLCFGENLDPPVVHLPRAGVLRRGGLALERVLVGGLEPQPGAADHPGARQAHERGVVVLAVGEHGQALRPRDHRVFGAPRTGTAPSTSCS